MPAGTSLKDQSGDLTISKAGTVVSGIHLKGCITVTAPNVTVENSLIEATCGVTNKSTNFTIRDSEVDGLGNPDSIGVSWGNFTMQRVEIRNTGDGVRANGNSVVEDSWIHTMANGNDTHNDGIQITEGSNVKLVHNTVQNQLGQTSAIMIGADQGNVSNVVVSNNLLEGGGYALYGGQPRPGSDPSAVQNITISGNRFARSYFKLSGEFGPMAYANYPGCTATDNRYLDTNALVS